MSVLLRFGGAITPRAVLSGEFIGWARTFYDGTTEALAWSMVVTQFYPSPASGFYVKLGSGLATGQLTAFVPGFGSVQMNRGAGVGIDVGAGFDMPVSRGFSFTPFVDYLYGSPSSIVVNGTDTGSKLGTNLVHIGLAASWR